MTVFLAVAVLAADPPTLFPPRDFVEYWSAARVHLRGGDPYSGEQLLPLQREALGEPDRTLAISLWTPPWTLPLYWPCGALPAFEGHLLWVVTQGLAVAVGAVLLWRAFGGPTGTTPAGRLLWGVAPVGLAAGFAPVWWMTAYGQNTGLLVLGLAGFVFYRQRGRPLAAGAFAALTAIKPHLLAAFGVVLVLDAITRDGRRALLAGVGMIAVGAGLAVVPNAAVFGQFREAVTRPKTAAVVPLSQWQVPTLGYQLRKAVAGDRFDADSGAGFAVQFVPCAAACLFAAGWRLARGARWDWTAALPGLVYLSVLSAPYGAWMFDLTVLLVPLARTAARLARLPRPLPAQLAASGLLALSFATVFAPQVLNRPGPDGFQVMLHHYVWFAPAVLGLDLLVSRMLPNGRSSPDT